jgi:hypothetical protein
MLTNNKYKTLALLIVPFLLAVVDFFFLKAAFPLHSGSPGYDQDPAYAYLFNGLLILEGYPPHHIDHPGTPLQLLFALTIFIRWGLTQLWGESTSDIVDSVINSPELYLHDMALLLLALNLTALVFFGRRIAEATGKIYLGMFCQLSLLSFTIMAPKATYPAPEALLIFCSLILLGQLAPRIFAGAASSKTDPIVSGKLVGAAFALGLAIKITFLPMALLLVLLPKGIERRAAIIASLLIFLLLTAPALPNIGRFLIWVTGLISNSGIHGGGEGGVVDITKIPGNLYNLFLWFPLFVTALTLATVAVTKAIITKSSLCVHGPIVLISISVIQTLLVLKHPGAHYMIAVLPIGLMLSAWLALFINPKIQAVRILLVTLACILLLHSVLITFRGIKKFADQREEMTVAMAEVNRQLSLYPNALIVCSFRCALPAYALTMALIYSPQLVSKKITDRLTNFYDFDIFQSKLVAIGLPSKTWTDMDEYLAAGGTIIVVSPKIYTEFKNIRLIPLTSNQVQNAYLYIPTEKVR